MRRGFTLVELLTVLAIVAILASMASVRYGHAIARQRVEAAARRVVTDLELLRSHARLKSSDRTMRFNPATDSYGSTQIAALDDPDGTYSVDLTREPYGVDLVSANFGGDANVTFHMDGRPDSGGTLVLRTGEWSATVTLDADSGRVSWN